MLVQKLITIGIWLIALGLPLFETTRLDRRRKGTETLSAEVDEDNLEASSASEEKVDRNHATDPWSHNSRSRGIRMPIYPIRRPKNSSSRPITTNDIRQQLQSPYPTKSHRPPGSIRSLFRQSLYVPFEYIDIAKRQQRLVKRVDNDEDDNNDGISTKNPDLQSEERQPLFDGEELQDTSGEDVEQVAKKKKRKSSKHESNSGEQEAFVMRALKVFQAFMKATNATNHTKKENHSESVPVKKYSGEYFANGSKNATKSIREYVPTIDKSNRLARLLKAYEEANRGLKENLALLGRSKLEQPELELPLRGRPDTDLSLTSTTPYYEVDNRNSPIVRYATGEYTLNKTMAISTSPSPPSPPSPFDDGFASCHMHFECSIRLQAEREKCMSLRPIAEAELQRSMKSRIEAILTNISYSNLTNEAINRCYDNITEKAYSSNPLPIRPLTSDERVQYQRCLDAIHAIPISNECRQSLIHRVTAVIREALATIEAASLSTNQSYAVCKTNLDKLAGACSHLGTCCTTANGCDNEFQRSPLYAPLSGLPIFLHLHSLIWQNCQPATQAVNPSTTGPPSSTGYHRAHGTETSADINILPVN